MNHVSKQCGLREVQSYGLSRVVPPDQRYSTIAVKVQSIRRCSDMVPTVKKPYATTITTTLSHLQFAAMIGICWRILEDLNESLRAKASGLILTGGPAPHSDLAFTIEVTETTSFRERRLMQHPKSKSSAMEECRLFALLNKTQAKSFRDRIRT
ncbi:hypothetical protein CDEST_09026 [Colletotrichum destructivum]|uniref:Uncharacterized protein n=1 Tax=Colletotrichum destructivum TaxID=34406 RepID=A0AAX4IKX5_9PEZI|nr:hypothetical protein CDEST_09026 [Colletotrichum destructivum]